VSDRSDFVARLPKAELHIHLEGAVSQDLHRVLAAKYGLPAGEDWVGFPDLTQFLAAYEQVCAAMRAPADFEATTYAALKRAADCNARYVELFFSPDAHDPAAIRYPDMLDGIIAGAQRALDDFGLVSRIVPAHNRELGPARGMALLDKILAHRRDEVVGIGLDYGERLHPPAQYREMFEVARRHGLQTTAHAGEDGPAGYVRDAIEVLGCRRIDHGYHVVDDPGLVEMCRELDILFTVCPTTTLHTTPWRDLHGRDHAIRRMIEEGLRVMINTDDPGMFVTDLNREYLAVAEAFDLSAETLSRIAANGFSHCWTAEGRAAGLALHA
jgi:adenosine deaminase